MICIPLMIEHLFLSLMAICMLPLGKCLFRYSAKVFKMVYGIYSTFYFYFSFYWIFGGWHWTMQVSRVQLNKTLSAHCLVCPLPQAKCSSVPIYSPFAHLPLVPTPLPCGYHHAVVCVYVIYMFLLNPCTSSTQEVGNLSWISAGVGKFRDHLSYHHLSSG